MFLSPRHLHTNHKGHLPRKRTFFSCHHLLRFSPLSLHGRRARHQSSLFQLLLFLPRGELLPYHADNISFSEAARRQWCFIIWNGIAKETARIKVWRKMLWTFGAGYCARESKKQIFTCAWLCTMNQQLRAGVLCWCNLRVLGNRKWSL